MVTRRQTFGLFGGAAALAGRIAERRVRGGRYQQAAGGRAAARRDGRVVGGAGVGRSDFERARNGMAQADFIKLDSMFGSMRISAGSSRCMTAAS